MDSKLASVQVNDLFGQFNHKIPLNQEEHITAILAPNGYGKTVCLKFIEALFRNRFSYFNNVDFKSIEFLFTGGEKITISKIAEDAATLEKEPDANKLPVRVFFLIPVAIRIHGKHVPR